MRWNGISRCEFYRKSMETEKTTWWEFPNRGKVIKEQILASQEKTKSTRAGLWKSQSGIRAGKLTIWVMLLEIITEFTRSISSGCYLELLGRWRFKGIGKNVSKSLLCQYQKRISNASVIHEVLGAPRYFKVYGQTEAKEPPTILMSLKPKNKFWTVVYLVLYNKLIATTKNTTKDCWSVEKFYCFKNGLTYPNQQSETVFRSISLMI